MNWRPNQKLACYLIASFLSSFIGQASLVGREVIATWGWWDWSIFWAVVLSAVVVTWRAFVDQSKQLQDNNAVAVPTAPPPPAPPPKTP